MRSVVLAIAMVLASAGVDAKSHKQPPPQNHSKATTPDGSGKPQIQQLGQYCDTSSGRYKLAAPQMLGSACTVNTPKGAVQGTVGS